MSWVGICWYIKPVAEAAAARGRYIIVNTIESAKKVGLEVVYSDTDGVFVKNEASSICLVSRSTKNMKGNRRPGLTV